MDRTQILLVGLPLFLFFSDILNLFVPAPPPKDGYRTFPDPKPTPQPNLHQPLEFPAQVSQFPSSKFMILHPLLMPIPFFYLGFF